MKNYRGTALANLRQGIFMIFGSNKLPQLPPNASARTIMMWKKNEKVKQCHQKLFEPNEDGYVWASLIARETFSLSSVPILSNHHLVFTIAGTDIYLNPKSWGIQCTEKEMKKRIEFYLVCKNSNDLSRPTMPNNDYH